MMEYSLHQHSNLSFLWTEHLSIASACVNNLSFVVPSFAVVCPSTYKPSNRTALLPLVFTEPDISLVFLLLTSSTYFMYCWINKLNSQSTLTGPSSVSLVLPLLSPLADPPRVLWPLSRNVFLRLDLRNMFALFLTVGTVKSGVP